MATHSQYILEEALTDPDAVVVRITNEYGRIEAKKIDGPFILPTITAAEINYQVFGISSRDYHNQLYGCLQYKINSTQGNNPLCTISECDKYILNSSEYQANVGMYYKKYVFGNRIYETLPTYIRNQIDHPSLKYMFTNQESQNSIELLIKLCK